MSTIGNIIVNLYANTVQFVDGIKKSKESLMGFSKSIDTSLKSMNRMLTLGVVGRVVRGVVDGVTEFSKAVKEGQSGLVAFVEALPILGQIEKAFADMYSEVSGLRQEMEALDNATKTLDDRNKDYTKMQREFKIESAGEREGKELAALYEYEDRLKKINEIEAKLRKEQKLNPDILLPNMEMDKQKALDLYAIKLSKINDEFAEKKRKQIEDYNKKVLEFKNNILDMFKQRQESLTGMQRNYSILEASPDQAKALEIYYKYLDTLKEIYATRKKFLELKNVDKLAVVADFQKEENIALNTYRKELELLQADILERNKPDKYTGSLGSLQELNRSYVDVSALGESSVNQDLSNQKTMIGELKETKAILKQILNAQVA